MVFSVSMMRVTVAMLAAFSEDLEGRVECMYLDARGLVTTGLGNLVEPREAATHLPWRHRSDGELATLAEVIGAWRKVKGMQANKAKALPYRCEPSLVLDDEAIDELIQQRLESNHEILRRRWPDIDTWPIDAELFVHSWAWAVGANSAYPRMSKCLRARDFAGAAREAKITPNEGSIVTRNARNQVLLVNAAIVESNGLDADRLHWPDQIGAGQVTVAADVPTVPEDPAQRIAFIRTIEVPVSPEAPIPPDLVEQFSEMRRDWESVPPTDQTEPPLVTPAAIAATPLDADPSPTPLDADPHPQG